MLVKCLPGSNNASSESLTMLRFGFRFKQRTYVYIYIYASIPQCNPLIIAFVLGRRMSGLEAAKVEPHALAAGDVRPLLPDKESAVPVGSSSSTRAEASKPVKSLFGCRISLRWVRVEKEPHNLRCCHLHNTS